MNTIEAEVQLLDQLVRAEVELQLRVAAAMRRVADEQEELVALARASEPFARAAKAPDVVWLLDGNAGLEWRYDDAAALRDLMLRSVETQGRLDRALAEWETYREQVRSELRGEIALTRGSVTSGS